MANIKDIVAGMNYVKIMVDNQALEKGLLQSETLMKRFGDTCASIGSKLAATGVMLSAPFVNAVRIFSQFDDQMRMTRAVTGATSQEFDQLIKRARQIGRETAFSASQAAAGMTSLGRMGFGAQEIDQAVPSVTQLALATGTDLAQAADIAANSMRMFKLRATDMTRVADVLGATANGSAQTLSDLFEALRMAGPQAAVANESLEDTAAAIGVMANVGIKGSMAGTALRRAYTNLADGKIQAYLEQYNIKTVDANNNLRKMKDIIIDVARAMSVMGTAEKMSFATEVFGQRGAQAALTLGGDVEGMQEFARKLEEEVDGYVKRTSEDMESGLGGAFRKLASAWQDANLAIADTINETVVPLLHVFTQVANAVSAWVTENASLVRSLAIGAGAILTVGAALTATGIAIGAMGSATGNLRLLFTKITAPFTAMNQAAKDAVNLNVSLAASKKAVTTAAHAQIQAEGAAIATSHAQQQVTAAQIALAKARTPAEEAAARAAQEAATANLQQAQAAEKSAAMALQEIAANEAQTEARKSLTLAQQHEAQTATAAQAAQVATQKQLALAQAEQALAQKQVALETARSTGVNIAAAKADVRGAQAARNKAAADYEVAKSEAARAAVTQAALSPQIAQAAQAKKLLDLLRLQPTAANLAMASFLTLSNAQAGTAAQAAMLSCLRNLRNINLTLGAQAIKNKIAALWTNNLTAAQLRQALAATATTVKTATATASVSALGIAAKIATAGVLGLQAALNLLLANPVIAALAAIALIYYNLARDSREAAKNTAAMATAAANRTQDVNTQRQKDRERETIHDDQNFARLRELSAASQQAKLTAEQIEETEKILARLASRGFSNLPKLDKFNASLQAINDNTKESFEATKRQHDRKNITSEYQDTIAELEKRRQSYQNLLQKGVGLNWSGAKTVYRDEAKKELQRIQELSQKLAELNKASLESDAGKADKQAQKAEQTLSVSVAANTDAQKRLEEITKKIADDKLSDIEREINGIRDLRDEYTKLLRLRLDFEKNKPKPNLEEVHDLEAQLAAADSLFQGMQDAAYEEHHKENYADLDAISQRREQDRQRKEETARENAELEKMRQTAPTRYRDTLNQMIEDATTQLNAATDAYKQIKAEVSAEDSPLGKGIDQQEKQRLDLQKELYDIAQDRVDNLRSRLLDLDLDFDDLKANAGFHTTLGSFFTSDILNLFQQSSGPEEETARNTRATANNLASLIDIVRDRRPPAFS